MKTKGKAIRWSVLLSVLLRAASAGADVMMSCVDQNNFACANGGQTANQTVTTVWNLQGTNSPLTFDGTTGNSNRVTLALSTDPAASYTFTVPGDAASAAGRNLSANCGGLGANYHVNQFNATTGAFTCTADTGGNPTWDAITAPTSTGQSLGMGAWATTWTWGSTTGTTNLFDLSDGTNNTGTGNLLYVHTAAGSGVQPFRVTAQGTANGVALSTTGGFARIGTGTITATHVMAGGLANTLTWNQTCTASPCTLTGTPRLPSTILVVYHGIVWRNNGGSCTGAGVNEYSLAGTTLTKCASSQTVGAVPDNLLVTYEM